MHTMATHHEGKGCPIDWDINLHVEGMEGIYTRLENDNKSTSGSDTTILLGGSEADCHPDDLLFSNQAKLKALMTEINDLCQWVEAREGQPAEGLDLIEWELLKSLSHTSATTFLNSNTYWIPQIGTMSVHQHIVYHTETNTTDSLLQDIIIFNEYNSTKLEEWLMDIETAADLTNEIWPKLAKAKSRALTHTLVSEAITSEKSWEVIKDLLRLKLCNTNIHTYTSHFMDIQQKEKELLAAYIHWLKTKANRWNFSNDAATIRIFVKGFKNAHSLATHIYKKGPETLTDAISEVEKLNVTQQQSSHPLQST